MIAVRRVTFRHAATTTTETVLLRTRIARPIIILNENSMKQGMKIAYLTAQKRLSCDDACKLRTRALCNLCICLQAQDDTLA